MKENNVKKNVQVYTAKKAYETVYAGTPTLGKVENLRFDENGTLRWTEGGRECRLEPNDLASEINMPRWEVVMVDNGGEDEFAIELYEF